MNSAPALLWFATLLSFYGLGVIWVVQIVIYPLFLQVEGPGYVRYHKAYSSRILLPIVIPGFMSFLVPLAFLFVRPVHAPDGLVYANIACGIAALLTTVALEIPRHLKLELQGRDERVIRELILYNWPRTLAMTGSAVLSLLMLLKEPG